MGVFGGDRPPLISKPIWSEGGGSISFNSPDAISDGDQYEPTARQGCDGQENGLFPTERKFRKS